MPTLLTRGENQLQQEAQPCDFSNPLNNTLTSQQVTLEELRAQCERYRLLLQSLNPSQESTMIRAASFTTDSVRQLLDSNPQSAFIRVYYGIKDTGEHLLFMGPVPEETSSTAISGTAVEEESLYVENCCACPPRLNCPTDDLLVWEP